MELPPRHYDRTIHRWKTRFDLNETDEFIKELYKRFIAQTHCELCNKEFKFNRDRQMEHDHETGKFRNIVCNKCNHRKSDLKLRTDNKSGYKGIGWMKSDNIWRFRAVIDGKQKTIKKSVDFDKLVIFADKWKKENDYYK
mgnify:CR=1 FL=1